MQNTIHPNKGFGSSFSYIEYNDKAINDCPNNFLPINTKLFYSGRHAIKYVIDRILLDQDITTFWIPEYYCQHVAKWLKTNYNNIKTYPVNPLHHNHMINGDEFMGPNDVILVNNFWGISQCLFQCTIKQTLVIEDHSHGWLSNSCKQSKADFCIASLRKSVPVPLGGIAWKPNGEKIKDIEAPLSNVFDTIWNNIESSMSMKKEYEFTEFKNESLKNDFLKLVYEAEDAMHHNFELVTVNDSHRTLICDYLKIDYLKLKQKNFKALIASLKNNKAFNIVTKNTTPFGLTLHFNNFEFMSAFKTYLVKSNIYPSLLWPDNITNYGYFLNIHIDYRYNEIEMQHISNIINNFNF